MTGVFRLFYRSVFVLGVLLLSVAQAQTTQEVQNPFQLLEAVADGMIERISKERAQIEANPSYLRTIMEEELLPHSDYQYAARMVVGRHWQQFSETQQKEFEAAFRDYLVTTYARVFTQYDEAKHTLKFGSETPYEKERRVVVRAQLIEQGGRPPIRIDFHLQRRSPTSPWLAYDIVAEGISMLNAQQSEMQAALRQRGIDGTIELLKTRAGVEIDLNEEIDIEQFKG